MRWTGRQRQTAAPAGHLLLIPILVVNLGAPTAYGGTARTRTRSERQFSAFTPRPLALVVQGDGALLPLLLAATSHPAGASSAYHPHLHLPHPRLLLSTRSTSSSSNPSSITTPTPNSTHRQEPTLALIWAGEPIDPGPWPALFHAAGFVV
jgi:hypothetical protein